MFAKFQDILIGVLSSTSRKNWNIVTFDFFKCKMPQWVFWCGWQVYQRCFHRSH